MHLASALQLQPIKDLAALGLVLLAYDEPLVA